MSKRLYVYAWDFIDEGLDEVLERIRSLGMDGIAMAVSYHAGKFILPHNPNRRVYFPEDGTVYFRPRAGYYPGPIRPEPASILGSGDILAEVADGCKRFGLSLTAWTVCMHNTRLGTNHPEFTARNAFGDHYLYCLCPAQPAASEYALGMIRDLTENYDLDTVFLEALGYMGFAHGFHHEIYGVGLNACQESLLSLCFCDACAAKAAESGIDAGRVAEIVRRILAPAFANDVEQQGCDFAELVDRHPELAAYLRMRCDVVIGLLEKAREIAGTNGVTTDYFGPSPCSRALPEATDIARAGAIADHYVLPIGTPDLARIRADIERVRESVASDKIILSINLGMTSTPTRANYLDKMALLDEYGLSGCNLYNYSILPFKRLEWLAH